MRNRVLSLGCAVVCACALAAATATAAERDQSGARVIADAKASETDRPATTVKGTPLFSDVGEPMGMYYPMSREDQLMGSVAGEPDPDAACRDDPAAVYCNALSPGWWRPPGDNFNITVADDASLASIAGCQLDRYVIKVTGNADGLGVGGYTVTTKLYPTCPGAGNATPIAGTTHTRELETAEAVTITVPAPPGTLLQHSNGKPVNNLYVGIKFSRLHCGIAVGAPATKGYSADSLDFPGFACIANLGGFYPENVFDAYRKHASFYLEIYTRGDCADPLSDPPTEAFPNYKSSNHAGLYYTPGGGIYYADDVSLEVPQCWMTAMEVPVNGTGVVNVTLRTGLNDADPANGGVIPGTGFFLYAPGRLAIARKDFDPPILLTQPDLWVGYHTSSAVSGPVLTGREADLGDNEDSMWIHDQTRWNSGPLTGRPYAATDVTIHCADWPPEGACCDMILKNNRACVGGDNHGQFCTGTIECPGGTCVGDSVCRDDLPAMNCASGHLPQLWIRGGECLGECVGGDLPGADCTRQIDCPGFRCVGGVHPGDPCETDEECGEPPAECKRAACDGPFIRSCGLAACCTAEDECFDLIEKECFELPPIEEPRKRMFQLGQFCGLSGQRCPFGACLGREGDCRVPREEPGCGDPFCCTAVCLIDIFCCLVEWDEFCVGYAIDACENEPANDECFGRGVEGARTVRVGGNILVDIDNGTTNPSDPGFCCHNDEPGDSGLASVWFKFVGPEPGNPEDEFAKVRVDTCQSNSSQGRDSLLQVFTAADPDRGVCGDGAVCSIAGEDCADGSICLADDETACRTLIPVACNDDAVPACPRPGLSRICMQAVPGQTYYVMVAAKSDEFRDTYRLDVAQNCTLPDPPMPNDECSDAEPVAGGTPEPLVIPFDLSGGEEYKDATFDCLIPTGPLPNMENDIWYDWVAPCDAEATIETCDHSASSEDQPNTTLIVYKGCDCPVPDALRIGWSDFCGFECGLSSCVNNLQVTDGQCYKIRLGGHRRGTPAGDLTISIECPECPVGAVTFLDPEDGTVDARQPHPIDDAGILWGIDSFIVEAPEGADMNRCWTFCETADTGTVNFIADIIDNGDGTYTLQLDRPITTGEVTTITYTDADAVETRGIFMSHPANVDGNPFSQGADVSAIINAINGAPTAHGIYSTDINHSGMLTAADMLRVIDLLNGADPFERWGEDPRNARPACGVCCP